MWTESIKWRIHVGCQACTVCKMRTQSNISIATFNAKGYNIMFICWWTEQLLWTKKSTFEKKKWEKRGKEMRRGERWKHILKHEKKILSLFFTDKEVANSDEWIFGIWLQPISHTLTKTHLFFSRFPSKICSIRCLSSIHPFTRNEMI